MKTIIFSDTHLTRRFNLRKFLFLVKIIKDADRVIINGDFWDKTFTTFDGFVNSKWKLLFPLLKSKKTIYIYGNHDPEDKVDERVNLFSDKQGYEHRLIYADYDLIITHGDRIRRGMEYLNKFRLIDMFKRPLQVFFDAIEWFGIKLIRSFGKSLFFYRYLDNRHIREFAQELSPEQYIVCGHTHLAYFRPGFQYINTGSIRFGHAHYLELNNQTLQLKYSRY